MMRIDSRADVPRAPWYVVGDNSTPKHTRALIIPAKTHAEAQDLARMERLSKRCALVGVTKQIPPINPDKVEWSMPIEHALISDLPFPLPLRKGSRS